MRIRVTVQHQGALNIAGWRLHSRENDNNQVYVNMVDNFYVIVHTRIKRVVFKKLECPEEQKTDQSRAI